MKNIFLLFSKDFRLFLKNSGAVTLTFIVPMVLILIFGSVFSSAGKSTPLNSIPLVVVDNDNSKLSQNFVTYIDSLKEIKILTKFKNNNQLINYDESLLKKHIKKGKRKIGLIIPEGFSEKILSSQKPQIEVFYDPKYQIEYGIVTGLIQKTLMSKFPELFFNSMLDSTEKYLGKTKNKLFKNDLNQIIKKYFNYSMSDTLKTIPMGSFIENEEPVSIKVTKLVGEEIKNPMFAQSVAGMAVMFLLFSLARAGSSILEEKNMGTMDRLLIAPVTPSQIIFSKLLFASFLGIFQLIVMFIFGWMIFALDVFSHIPALLVMILSTSLAASALGMFIAAIAKNNAQVNGLTTLIALGMSALGGSMFPTIIMPEYMQKIGKFTLNYWATNGFTNIFWRNMGVKDISTDAIVLLCIFVVLSSFSIIIFKRKLFAK